MAFHYKFLIIQIQVSPLVAALGYGTTMIYAHVLKQGGEV